MFSVTCFKQ